jgi:catechol 2,3-dioxygenase-like lactoylglutathione lyase family enzyme
VKGTTAVDYRLELIPLPVADVDRAKAFYADRLGFKVDLDFSPNEAFRVVQLTPPGSACSVAFGAPAAPASWRPARKPGSARASPPPRTTSSPSTPWSPTGSGSPS